MFCKHYDFATALDIIEKRFHRHIPVPQILNCEIFEAAKRRAEKRRQAEKKREGEQKRLKMKKENVT